MPTPLQMPKPEGTSQAQMYMTFSQAMDRLLEGAKVRRAEWMEPGVHLFMGPYNGSEKTALMIHTKRVVPAESVGLPAREEWSDDYLVVTDGDMLGEDWVVVE